MLQVIDFDSEEVVKGAKVFDSEFLEYVVHKMINCRYRRACDDDIIYSYMKYIMVVLV